jgi:hypothetical protein
LEENAQAKPSLPERQPPERPFFELRKGFVWLSATSG